MYPISSIYAQYLKRYDREFLVKADVAGVEYANTTIVEFSIENSLAMGEDIELGTANMSKLTLTLRTQDVVPTNARIIPYLGLSLSQMRWIDADMAWQDDNYPWTGGATEWLPMGEFYVDSRQQVADVWVYTCYDKLVWADAPYISSLTYPATMQDVWDEICDRLGYAYDSSVQINPNYMIEVGPAGYSYRQVMGYIAGANAASVFVDKAGIVKFRRFTAAEPAVFAMGQSDYIRATQTNPIRTLTRVVVTYNTEDGLAYEAGEGSDNQTLAFENPFVTQQVVDDLQATLDGYSYMPIKMDARGFPQLEAGDRISFERNESQSWAETFTSWQDMDLPWTGGRSYETIALHTVYTFRGGLRMSIEAPSKSEQQSEFPVAGPLTTAVNNLNKTTVKEGRSYFGATLTRTDGLTIEREDHLSKLILNSDLMSWQVDGDDALYYDNLAHKLRYKGDIEMLGGSISWTEVNPPTPADVGALPEGTTATDIGGVADDDGRLAQLNGSGTYTGSLGQSQVSGLVAALSNLDAFGVYGGPLSQSQVGGLLDKLSKISSIGDYIGDLSQGQVTGLSTRLTKITSTGVYTGTVGTDQLVAGTSLIGTALIESLVVGSNVTMGPLATISWTQVTSKPTIPTLPSYIKSTYIDSTTIQSPTISAGTITGALIQTASSGTRITLSSSGNLLTAYYNDNDYLTINPLYGSGPAFEFYKSGSRIGSFLYQGTPASVWINTQNDLVLNANGVVAIQGGWSKLSASGQTMATALSGKANTSHTHSQSDVTGLTSALSSINSSLANKATSGSSTSSATGGSHNHGIPDGTKIAVWGTGNTVTGYYTWTTFGGWTHSHTQN